MNYFRLLLTFSLMAAMFASSMFPSYLNAQASFVSLYKASNSSGSSIQEAINAANDGDTILINSGVYVENSYPIIVNKSLTVIGEDPFTTIIDGNKTDRGIFLVKANNVRIGNLTIQNTTIETYAFSGVHIYNVQNVTVFDLVIRECGSGIQVTNSTYCVITRNNITSNNVGIYLHSDSSYNNIADNFIANSNSAGVWIADTVSPYNKVFHNSFVNNTQQQSNMGSYTSWDDGYPSGGNYWSDCSKIDIYNGAGQNISGSDGLVDVAYMDIDHYPLVEPPTFVHIYSLDKQEYYCVVISNTSTSDFYFNPEVGSFINFTVQSVNDGVGFCRISVPKALLWVENGEQWSITINGTFVNNPSIFEDNAYTYFYLTYGQGIFQIKIEGHHVIPEIPSNSVLIFLISLVTIFFAVIEKLKPIRPSA